MVSASSLSTEQKQQIAQWVAAGEDLNGIQKLLGSEMKLSPTYMDTRFLIMDLGLEIVTDPEPAADEKAEAPQVIEAPTEVLSGVQVMLDEDPIPGCMISGVVTFSDGEKGMWYVDQSGQPGLEADTPGYQPSSDDVEAFQIKLRELVIKQQEEFGRSEAGL